MKSFIKSFIFAITGIKHALLTENNFRLQWLCALLVLLLNLLLNFELNHQIVFLILIAGVLSLELMNSAIDRTCDASGQAFNEQKKDAKDAAAGSVLLFSAGACLILTIILINAQGFLEAIMLQPLPWLSLFAIFIINFPLCLNSFGIALSLILIILSGIAHLVLALHMNSNVGFLLLGLLSHGSLMYVHIVRALRLKKIKKSGT